MADPGRPACGADEAAGLLRMLQWSARTASGAACCPLCQATEAAGRHAETCRLAACLTVQRTRRWRHARRGTTYVELGRATLQHSGGPLDDGDTMMVYRSESDGTLGVRALIEFSDGRFTRL